MIIGPIENHEAQNIIVKLIDLGVEFEVKRSSVGLLLQQTHLLSLDAQKKTLSIELQKSDFETNKTFFQPYGVEIQNQVQGSSELDGYQPTGWLNRGKLSALDMVSSAALGLFFLLYFIDNAALLDLDQKNAIVTNSMRFFLFVYLGIRVFQMIRKKNLKEPSK